MNLAVSFTAGFAGSKNTKMQVQGFSGQSGWVVMGTWTVPGTVTVATVSVTPSSGSGTQQTFNLVYTDSAGMSDLNTAWVWFDNSASSSVTRPCLAYSYPRANALYLLNDAGSAFLGPITVGSSNSLSNSQCTISGSGSSTSTAGSNLTVNLAVSFTAGFAGSKNTKMQVQGFSGQSGWVVMGTWTVPGTVTVATVSVTPSSGSGTQQTFNLVYTDSAGMSDLNTAWVWFDNSASSSVTNTCLAYSYPRANALYLLNDAGSAFLGPITVGSSNSLSNSQCTISGSGSSTSTAGSNLTVNLAVSFTAGFAGSKNTKMQVQGFSGQSGWVVMGSWTVH